MIPVIKTWLLKPIDPIQVALWRIVFGLVMVFECFGAVLIGWTKMVFIDPPSLTFNFIGLEWLQPLPGNGMYFYFIAMGCLAVFITIGWKFRYVMPLFAIGWAGLYFMHKTSYNNHHYLMFLLSGMFCFTPAHVQLSLDARRKAKSTIPNLFRWQYLILFLIAYTYASLAKFYPDWISGRFTSLLVEGKETRPFIGWLYRAEYAPLILAWGGIFYDLLVIPALLWKRTRNFALAISIGFHLYNSITLEIGTFPYMMIGASVLFFPPELLRKRFKRHPNDSSLPALSFHHPQLKLMALYLFIAIQVVLPLRHHIYPGTVFWTEEGHRLSWRMMLRYKSGRIHFTIYDKNNKLIYHNPLDHITKKQLNTMCSHPDMIWQYAQFLKKIYGDDIRVYVKAYVSLNRRPMQQLMDPNVDLAHTKWHRFKHSKWILPFSWDDERPNKTSNDR